MNEDPHVILTLLQVSCVSLLRYDEQDPTLPAVGSHESVIHLCSWMGAKPKPCLTANSLPAGILYTYYTDESETGRKGETEKVRREKVGPRGKRTEEGRRGTRSMRG